MTTTLEQIKQAYNKMLQEIYELRKSYKMRPLSAEELLDLQEKACECNPEAAEIFKSVTAEWLVKL